MSVGENIKKMREEKNTGVTQAMICQIERGTKNPSLQVACQIAKVLGCEVNSFMKEV